LVCYLNEVTNRMKKSITIFLIIVMGMFAKSEVALAGPGHDHGESQKLHAGIVMPRFFAESDLYEVVGVVKGKKMTVYLDRFQTNETVNNADIQIDFDDQSLRLIPKSDGVYEGTFGKDLVSKEIAVSIFIKVGDESDILVTTYDSTDKSSKDTFGWQVWGTWIATLFAVIAVFLLMYYRRHLWLPTAQRLVTMIKEKL